MNLFNRFVSYILKIEETTLTNVFGNTGQYAEYDNRPIDPASIVLGVKNKKNKKIKPIPIQRRPGMDIRAEKSK